MPNLFRLGLFRLHSGDLSTWKIDCEALSDNDIRTLATIIECRFEFSQAVGIPKGGLRLAEELNLRPHTPGAPVLIVDDVLTTGNSMEEKRREIGGTPIGVVIFSRGLCPSWVYPIFAFWDKVLLAQGANMGEAKP